MLHAEDDVQYIQVDNNVLYWRQMRQVQLVRTIICRKMLAKPCSRIATSEDVVIIVGQLHSDVNFTNHLTSTDNKNESVTMYFYYFNIFAFIMMLT